MAYKETKVVQIVDLICDNPWCDRHLDTYEYTYDPDREFKTFETEYSFCGIGCLDDFIGDKSEIDYVLKDICKYPSNISEVGRYIRVHLLQIQQNSDKENN